MKRSILILTAAVTLLAYPAFGQTISILGTNGSTTAGSFADIQLSLQITGTNTIGDVQSANLVLRTPSTGVDSGVAYFTVQFLSATAPFNTANNTSSAMFTTTGDSNNTGFNVELVDMGANAPAGSNPVASSGTTTIGIDTIRFTADPSTPAGTYTFSATLGGFADVAQGSYISNMASAHFDVNTVPTFTITIIPEPATWSLMALGGLGVFGLNFLRRRRA